jgi:hypothetical protein
MVQDPNFWRRFSLAVHQDDLSKSPEHGDLKHSYVAPQHPSSAPLSPTSQHNLLSSPALSPAMSQFPTLAPAHTVPLRPEEIWQSEFEAEKQMQREQEAMRAPQKKRGGKLQKSASRASKRPLLDRSSSTLSRNTSFTFPARSPSQTHQKTVTIDISSLPQTTQTTPMSPLQRPPSALSLSRPLSFLRNPSTLSLSGRRGTVFKTWTEITANPESSDSWLAGQKKKSKQRAWLCGCFWLGVIVLVAGVVVAVLILKRNGII